jgi:hypothetical protein
MTILLTKYGRQATVTKSPANALDPSLILLSVFLT